MLSYRLCSFCAGAVNMIMRTGLTLIFALGVAGSVGAGERLEWKFRTGDVLTYNVRNTSDPHLALQSGGLLTNRRAFINSATACKTCIPTLRRRDVCYSVANTMTVDCFIF